MGGCLFMPNPLSTKHHYIFLGIRFIIPSNKILSTTDLEEARILKRLSSRSYGYLGIFCMEALVCMGFLKYRHTSLGRIVCKIVCHVVRQQKRQDLPHMISLPITDGKMYTE